MVDRATMAVPLAPPRQTGSVRRTTHIDVGPSAGDWSSSARPGLLMTGAARDLRTTDDTTEVLETARLELELDVGRRVRWISTTPAIQTEDLDGRPAAADFRGAAMQAVEHPASGLGVLLRDVPTAVLISGYALLRNRMLDGVPPGRLVPPGVLGSMQDLCSGWRGDGVMARSIAAGDGVPVQDCPPAQPLPAADERAWHDVPALPAGHMRRLRRIDVVRIEDEVVVDAMFRDSYAHPPSGDDADGVDVGGVDAADPSEEVLHAYSVAAWFGAESLELTEITTRAHVVPFGECLPAATTAARLVGTTAGVLREATRSHLSGTVGCTHLNDLLSCLADLPWLLAAAE